MMSSSADWLTVRSYVMKHRHELSAVAALSYPDAARVAGTPLLSTPAWLPARPVDLREIELRWTDAPLTGGPSPGDPPYSAVLKEHAPPAVFENRPTYRLRAADLASGTPWLSFGEGSYFDGVDVGEGAAHELAAALLSKDVPTRIREQVGDPCDLTRRPANMAISVLTLRHGPGGASFPLHWRDPAKVGHAGGLYMVVPVGVFQAPGFSLWDSMVREFAEELLGVPEGYDYASLPFARALYDGTVRAHCLGLGVDPLTFATDLMVAVVIAADLYDEWFGAMVETNDEGRLLERVAFTAGEVERFASQEPMQAAGAAQLRLAWEAREHLLPR